MSSNIVLRALEILEEALLLTDDARQDFVEEACRDDADLRREVDSMLVFESGVVIEGGASSDAPEDVVIPTSSSERYELRDEIGRGGMGIVFRAHDRQLDREVAVKVLRGGDGRSPTEMRRRFIVEAQIGARLQHPGVAPVYDLGQLPDGRAFFAMKLVAGETLASLLSARNDPADDRSRLLVVLEQLCQTIAFAHSHGIIHRDLKPDNVMVGEFGEVQVMDWGLAKAMTNDDERGAGFVDVEGAPQSPPSWSPRLSSQTRMGTVMGTPAYMPPEQATGERGKPTDVFSLGAILCEILTGTPPYTAGSPAEVYEKSAHADLEEALTRLGSCGADEELVQLATQCLEPASEDRPADAGEVAHRLTGYLQTVQSRLRQAEIANARAAAVSQEEKKRRRVTMTLMATALALVTLFLGGWGWISQRRAEDAIQRARVVQQVDEAKTEAILLRQLALDGPLDNLAAWAEAQAAIGRAESILETNAAPADLVDEVSDLARDIARQRTDRTLLAHIEGAREDATKEVNRPEVEEASQFERRRVALEAVFRGDLFHPAVTSRTDAIAQLNAKEARIREELIGALDEWLVLSDVDANREWISAVARAVDTNDWRKRWRSAVLAGELDELTGVSNDDLVLEQRPRCVVNLYDSLGVLVPGREAASVMRRVYPRHSGDFWLNFALGQASSDEADWAASLQYYSVALGSRPISSVYREMGILLYTEGRPDESIHHLEQALDSNPESGRSWEALGASYTAARRLEEAQSAWSRASELRPRALPVYANYADFLVETGRTEEAIEFLRKRQAPVGYDSANYQRRLVYLLKNSGRHLEAARVFQQPVERQDGGVDSMTHTVAAVAALHAADGQGVGAVELSEAERSELRQLALQWLRYCVEKWLARAPSAETALTNIRNARGLGHLVGVSRENEWEQLPPDEGRQWRRFWFNVEEAQRHKIYVDPDVDDLREWIVLDPTLIESDAGASFARQPDGSYWVTGPIEEGDTYSITDDLDPEGILALRLDTLADGRVGTHGAGRHATGNFQLAEISLEVLEDSESDRGTRKPFARAWASWSWGSTPVRNAIDGDKGTVWHVWGKQERSHSAIFYLPEPIEARGDRIRIRLVHAEGIKAPLGCFRLSVQRVKSQRPTDSEPEDD